MSNIERILSVKEAREIDQEAVTCFGMPTILLMENAARSVAEVAATLGQRFVILCGSGNNGGDGLAVARHLGFARCALHLLAAPDPSKAPDAALQHQILHRAGATLHIGTAPDISEHCGAVWIDALFGTGLDRELHDPARSWVDLFNHATGPKLAVDIPSGLHGDTGLVLGTACRVDHTVTFIAKKRGMLTTTGQAHCGHIHVTQLGLP